MEITESEKLRRLEQSKSDKIKAEQRKYLRKRTPLFDALTNVTKTKKLIDEGWDVNHLADNQLTPLFHAIKIGAKKEIIELLINSGAKVKQGYLYYMMKRGMKDAFVFILNVFKPHEGSYKTLLASSINLVLRNSGRKWFFLKLLEYGENFCGIDLLDVLSHGEENRCLIAFECLKDEDIKLFTKLLDLGVSVNAVNKRGERLLDEAVSYFRWRGEKAMYLLLKRGARCSDKTLLAVEIINKAGSEEDALRILKSVKKYIEDINAVDGEGKTAVMMALSEGYTKVYDYLSSIGAEKDVFKQGENVEQIIKSVIDSKNLKLIEKIEDKYLNSVKINGRSILHYAIEGKLEDCKDAMTLLMDKGAKFSENDKCYACVKSWIDDEPFVVRLIEAGYKADDFITEGFHGITHMSAYNGKTQIVLAILKKNAEMLSNEFGAVLLAAAILGGQEETFYELIKVINVESCYKDLLKIVSKLNRENYNGDDSRERIFGCVEDYEINPICAAIYKSQPEILKTLLSLGAQPKHHDRFESLYKNIFCYKLEKEVRLEMIKIVFNYGGKICDYWYACTKFLPDCLALLVKLDKRSVKFKTCSVFPGGTVLMDVVTHWFQMVKKERDERLQDFIDIVKILLDLGVDGNYKNQRNVDVLGYACYYKDEQIADILIGLGCGSDEGKKRYLASEKVFDLLSQKDKKVEEREIEELYNEGADFEFMISRYAYPDEKRSALITAIKNKHYNVLGTLLKLGANPFAEETYGENFLDHLSKVPSYYKEQVYEQILPYADKFNGKLDCKNTDENL